jgi:hypothetical protein
MDFLADAVGLHLKLHFCVNTAGRELPSHHTPASNGSSRSKVDVLSALSALARSPSVTGDRARREGPLGLDIKAFLPVGHPIIASSSFTLWGVSHPFVWCNGTARKHWDALVDPALLPIGKLYLLLLLDALSSLARITRVATVADSFDYFSGIQASKLASTPPKVQRGLESRL